MNLRNFPTHLNSHDRAEERRRIIDTCRQRMASLINAKATDWIVFAMNCSEALNIAIRGMLATAPRGTHAIATAMEHNSVLRPYHALAEQTGLEFDIVPCDPRTGVVDPDDIRRAIRPTTRLIVCAHASNVTGSLAPVAEVAAVAREREVPCLIDASQSAGHVPIDVQAIGADFMAFPGHKGLLGPLGTGMLYVRAGMEEQLSTMKEGGTGTLSELMTQPESMPDKLEIGSPNAIGIAGLSEGIAWIQERGPLAILEHYRRLMRLFMRLIGDLGNLRLYGPGDGEDRAAVFSVNVPGLKPLELSDRLEKEFGIRLNEEELDSPEHFKSVESIARFVVQQLPGGQ